MAEFLEVVESIRAEEATAQRIFAGEGSSAAARRGNQNPQYLTKLAEAAQIIANAYKGRRRDMLILQEAMTTSDFPLLFGDVLDRQVLASYREWPTIWNQIAKRGLRRDFRNGKSRYVDGGDGVLGEVAEQGEYPETSLSEGEYGYAVKKYGRRMPFSWESMINDDLDMLSDSPVRFGRAAKRTEDRFFTELHVGASGPHSSFYSVGNKNLVTGNPVLSIAALQSALTILASQVDAGGEPIIIDGVILEVPPALEVTAQNILNALQIELTEAGGTSGQKLVTANWVRNRVRPVVNPYIPVIAKTANGSTSWFLHAAPTTERPAIEMGFLRGHEEPQMFMKSANQTRVGGGQSNAMEGDFDTDSIEYKVRHVLGGTRMDPKATVASNGSGS